MKIRNAILVIVSVIGMLLGSGLSAFAAEPTGFKSVQLWVYPEYDDPRLLVMMQGQITGATAPVTVRFLVPTAAEMNSAGSMDAGNNYKKYPDAVLGRKASAVPGWDEVSYTLETGTFRVEYYDPVVPTDIDKKFAYDFRWLYPISDLRVVIQQPLKATDFVVEPKGTPSTERALGGSTSFNVFLYDYTNLDQGPPLHYDIAYSKPDPHPSITNTGAGAPGANTGNAAGTGTDTTLLVTTLVTVGVLLVVGVLWVVKSMQKHQPKRAAAKASTPSTPVRRQAGGQAGGKFCTQCGRKIDGQVKFCPECGAKQRPR